MRETAFMTRLRRGSPFLGGLISMREISTMAALIVRKKEIELRICNGGCTSLASLVLQASSMFSDRNRDSIAFRLDVNALAREILKFLLELNPSLRHGALLEDKPLWIYKMRNSDEICFLIGLNPNPVRLKPVFEAHLRSDPRDLGFLPVKITLKPECFRKLMESFAPELVEIYLLDDSVTWRLPSKKMAFIYTKMQRSECHVVGDLEGKPRHLIVDFLQTKALVHASHASKIAAWVHILANDVLGSWIVVLFPIGPNEFFVHLLRGLIHHDLLT